MSAQVDSAREVCEVLTGRRQKKARREGTVLLFIIRKYTFDLSHVLLSRIFCFLKFLLYQSTKRWPPMVAFKRPQAPVDVRWDADAQLLQGMLSLCHWQEP